MLYEIAKLPGYKPSKDEPKHPAASPLISPAVFAPGTTRKNINVQKWSALALLDVDDYSGSFDSALETFSGIRFCCYSSSSSRKEHPKFRMVLPLSESVQATDIRHFWFALNKEYNSLGDPQTKDLSRMYYVPAQYPGAFNFIVSNKKSPVLNVSALLEKYDYAREQCSRSLVSSLPSNVQKMVERYKQSRLTNTDFTWSGLNDCPFVNRKIIDEYSTISGTGWYRKMFSFMCSIAGNAKKAGYPISVNEISSLARELDNMTGGWYKNRRFESEAERAIAFALTSR